MARNIPTLDININYDSPELTNVDTGREGRAQMQSLADYNNKQAFKVAEEATRINARESGQQAAMRDGFRPEQLPEQDMTVATQVYRDGALGIYGVQLEQDTRERLYKLQREAERNNQSPQELANYLDNYLDEARKKVPAELREPFARTFTNERAQILRSAENSYIKRQQAAFKSRIESAKDTTLNIGIRRYEESGFDPATLDEYVNSYESAVRMAISSGAVGAEEGRQKIVEFHKDLYKQTTLSQFAASDDRAAFGAKIADDIRTGKNTILSREEGQKLIDSMVALDKDLNHFADKVAAKEKDDLAAQSAAVAANLEVAISRGEASYEDLDTARQRGLITDSKWADLVKARDKKNEDEAKEHAAFQAVTAGFYGTESTNPSDPMHRPAVDKLYATHVLPNLPDANGAPGGSPFEPQNLAVVSNLVQRTGILPTELRDQFRGIAGAGTPEQLAAAANLYDAIRESAPRTRLGISSQEEAVLQQTARLMKAGLDPIQAAERVRIMTDPNNTSAHAARKAELRETTKQLGPKEIQNMFDSVFSWEPELVRGLTADKAVTEFKSLLEAEYAIDGDMGAAKERAATVMSRHWGVSSSTGRKLLMKYPPENYYSVMRRGENDGSYIKEQLKRDIKQATGFEAEESDSLILLPDGKTAREAQSTGQPSYMVLIKNEMGAYDYARDGDGDIIRWRPDPKEAMREIQQDITKIREDRDRFRALLETSGKAERTQF